MYSTLHFVQMRYSILLRLEISTISHELQSKVATVKVLYTVSLMCACQGRRILKFHNFPHHVQIQFLKERKKKCYFLAPWGPSLIKAPGAVIFTTSPAVTLLVKVPISVFKDF